MKDSIQNETVTDFLELIISVWSIWPAKASIHSNSLQLEDLVKKIATQLNP